MHEHDTNENTATFESGCDAQGRFRKGNRGGPGNPHARRCAHLKQLLQSATSDEEVLEVLAILKRLALGGDVQAIKLFLAYQIGTPAEMPDPDTLDQQELKIALDNHAPCDREIFNVLHNFPADLLAEMLRNLLPQLAEHKRANLVDYLRDPLAQPHQEKRHCDVALERGPDQQPIPAAPGPCEDAGRGAQEGQPAKQRLGAGNGSDPGLDVAGRAVSPRSERPAADTNGANGISRRTETESRSARPGTGLPRPALSAPVESSACCRKELAASMPMSGNRFRRDTFVSSRRNRVRQEAG